MGKKLLSPLEDPPSASSSEAAEESLEVIESESELEQDEEEEEEEEEEDEEEEVLPELEQVHSKKASSPPEVKRTRSKSTATASAFVSRTPTKSSQKRPVEINGVGEGTSSKRAKKNKGPAAANGEETVEKAAAAETGGEGSKRTSIIQKFWSDEDEIVILEGIIDFSDDVFSKAAAFHESIMESLHVDASRTQLMNKIYRMKNKYKNNATGKWKNGEHRNFSSPHEQKVYNLSKIIWGEKVANNGGGGGGIDKRSTRAGMKEPPMHKEEHKQNVVGPSHDLLDDKSFMKDGLTLLNIATRSELEESWKNLKIAEAEQYLRRIELADKQTKLVLDAYKKL